MHKPFFSVVIPTHNRSMLLKRAIHSVLDQTFRDFEIIIVDDHSSDDTAEVTKSIKDPRLRYSMNTRSKGACGARNTGIFAARADWIALLDDDDVWLPDKLYLQYELILKAKKTVGLVCTDYSIDKGDKKNIKTVKNRPSGWVKKRILYGNCIGCLSSTCIRKDILYNIDGFDESFPSCQDQDIWLRVAEIAEFRHIPKTLVYMYQEKRERIGQNHESKLNGYLKLRNKFDKYIRYNFKVRHRIETWIFIYSVLLRKRKIVIKSFPWFLVGLIFDFPNFLLSIRKTSIILYKFRHKILSGFV